MQTDKPFKVLIVEDERIVALDIEAALKSRGYVIIGTCDSGEEAVVLSEKLQPDLILMDIHLKGEITGIEAAEAINQRSAIPIVYTTAHSDSSTLERAKQTRYYGYLVKPFNRKELHAEIELGLYKWAIERKAFAIEQLNKRLTLECAAPFALLDRDCAILNCNSALESIAGCPRDKIIGRSFIEMFISSDHAMAEFKRLAEALARADGASSKAELDISSKDKNSDDFFIHLDIFSNANEQQPEYFIFLRKK